MIRVLNLYAGIGGNRKLWKNVQVVAVELDPELAAIYKEQFPEDEIVVADAHEYLLQHYKEFDVIWSSRPCTSHSKIRFMGVKQGQNKPIYPDLGLYEEIIFLKHHFNGKFIVENVAPYYEPLITPQRIGRHCFWTNFPIIPMESKAEIPHKSVTSSSTLYGFNLQGKRLTQRKDQVLRNCVNPIIGEHVLKCALGNRQEKLLEVGDANA